MDKKEEYRKRKAIEVARKEGKLPPETDEDGRTINPHIPHFISKAPWYMSTGTQPSLKHQKTEQAAVADSSLHRVRVVAEERAQKYRKGACENCGAMLHKTRECVERPRAKGARWTSKDICRDEWVEEAKLGWEGKRDRWAGFDPIEYDTQVKSWERVEEERVRVKAERRRESKGDGKDDGKGGGTKESSASEASETDEEEKYAEKVDMPGQKVDTRTRMTVRNLRLREDTAKYLLNLDPGSAAYDPKTRSMKEAPLGKGHGDFVGDEWVKATGDVPRLAEMQVFAWQQAEHGVHLQANPSLTERLHRQHLQQQSDAQRAREQMLQDVYGDGGKSGAMRDSSEPSL